MRIPCLLLLAAASTATARTPVAPPSGVVADREAVRLLAAAYREKARLRGAWSPPGDRGVRRSVCADSGPQRGERRLAVCTAAIDGDPAAGGSVDLYVLAPSATRRGRAEVRARFTGIPAGAPGTAGDVRLFPVGPDRTAFLVESTGADASRATATTTLYLDDGAHLRDVLRLRSRLATREACGDADDAAGRRCRRRAVSLRCTLEADVAHPVDGWYPLSLHVAGERGGEAVDRRVPIPHDAYGYRIAARTLRTQGCDGDA